MHGSSGHSRQAGRGISPEGPYLLDPHRLGGGECAQKDVSRGPFPRPLNYWTRTPAWLNCVEHSTLE